MKVDGCDYCAQGLCEYHGAQARQTKLIREFLFDLTDPGMYGWAVSAEVRQRAIELLALLK